MPDVQLPPEAEQLLTQYEHARRAANEWGKLEKSLRGKLAALLYEVGITMDPEALDESTSEVLAGDTVMEVRGHETTRLNQDYLRQHYPEAYNASRKRTATYRMVFPEPSESPDGE